MPWQRPRRRAYDRRRLTRSATRSRGPQSNRQRQYRWPHVDAAVRNTPGLLQNLTTGFMGVSTPVG